MINQNRFFLTLSAEKIKGFSLGVVVLALFLAAVDSTIVSTLLPVIRHQLGDAALYPWIMSGFLLPVALVAPLAGACADRVGLSVVFKGSLVLFIIASALAAMSQNMVWLIVARVLQGISSGGIIVLAYSLLAVLFDEKQRGKMQGLLSGVWGLSAIIGPLLGSTLNIVLGWRSVFWAVIPLALIALVIFMMLPEVGRRAGKKHIDWWAQSSFIVLVCCVLLVAGHAGELSASGLWWGLALASVVVLVWRVVRSPSRSPFPLAFFQQRMLFAALVLILLSSATLYSSVTLLPMALNHDRSLLSAGLLIMLAASGWVIGAALCGYALAKVGFFLMALLGMLMLSVGCFAMLVALSQYVMLWIAGALLLIGLGMGFIATTTLVLVQNRAPETALATWTSAVQFLRNVGAAFGVTVLAAVQLSREAEPGSFQFCFMIMGISLLIGGVLCWFLPRDYYTD